MNFDDPKPKPDIRKQQIIYLRPSLKSEIDELRGKKTRSEWIEEAIFVRLAAARNFGI